MNYIPRAQVEEKDYYYLSVIYKRKKKNVSQTLIPHAMLELTIDQ